MSLGEKASAMLRAAKSQMLMGDGRRGAYVQATFRALARDNGGGVDSGCCGELLSSAPPAPEQNDGQSQQ